MEQAEGQRAHGLPGAVQGGGVGMEPRTWLLHSTTHQPGGGGGGRATQEPALQALGVQEERREWQGVTAVAGHASLWCCLRPLTELVSPVRPMRRKEGSPISQMLLCCLLRRGSKELKKEIFNNPPQLQ